MVAAYFVYGVAFADPDRVAMGQVLAALALSVVGLFAVAIISGREDAPKRALQAALVLVLIALPFGLLSRLMGAALGAGIGTAITLNPPRFANVFRNRLVAVVFFVAYAFGLLFLIPPAGVMTGALAPPLAVALADEYSAWRSTR